MSPGLLVQALTLSAADVWDMERIEILGDAFLKFSTTLFLHYEMPGTCDEGDLSMMARSKIVGNFTTSFKFQIILYRIDMLQ